MIQPILSQLIAIAASLFGISFIIVFHEFGHYIFCKIFNVYTPTFSIGIGKVLYSKKIGDTNFCISAGPIGGYVEVASEQGLNGSMGFNQIPYYQKVLIMLGGIFCNFLLAYLMFIGLFWSGMPENAAGAYEPCTTTIRMVNSSSSNANSLQSGDELLSINNQPLNNDLKVARKAIIENICSTSAMPAQVMRNGQQVDVVLHLQGKNTVPSITRQLDVSFQLKPSLSLRESIIESYRALVFYVQSIIAGLKNMIHARTTQGFVGPLMAVAASSKSAQKGISYLIFFLAVISINLGFMNLLPLPIFDGGQFVIFTTEAVTRRQLSEKVRNLIGISSWVMAIGLLIVFTIRDLQALIFG
jgi:regulator of sigma E protease